MFIITYAILLFSLISKKGSTWIDTAEGHIIEEDFNGSYIEKEIGQNVTLLCHGNASLLWDFDLDKNKLQRRIKVNDSVTTLSLFIRDLNVVDTGKYSCQESNMSMTRSHIHMFVRGKSAFVERPNTDPIKLLKNNLRIPCRASRWIKGEEMRLYVNELIVENIQKYYDPRIGFVLQGSSWESATQARCEHKNEQIDFQIQMLKLDVTSEDGWPQIGDQNYTITCVLSNVNQFSPAIDPQKNTLQFKRCPRCGSEHGDSSAANLGKSAKQLVGATKIEEFPHFR
ncbi:unnamed protein product, partial [Mesorhabditis belari]|uniref:Immunoglobulin domain-containing protein n=1 Tax=Mesorhabditis belari TaxID=2138241 RepID=A0AAF3FF28_9BILA